MATSTPPKWGTDAFRSFGPGPVPDRNCWSASRRLLGAKKLTEAGMSRASPVPAPPERRRVKEMEAVVVEVVRETPDTTTLVLFTGNERLDYEAGHFLTVDPHQFEGLERFVSFFEDLKGRKEPPRAYSMSSAPHERYIAITVKEERYVSGTTKYPPLLSPLLVHRTPRGTRLIITGFTGPYTLNARIVAKTKHIVHLCPGSGRVNLEMLKEILPVELDCHFFVCGPAVSAFDRAYAREKGVEPQPRFLESVLGDLKTLGVPRDQITFESYG